MREHTRPNLTHEVWPDYYKFYFTVVIFFPPFGTASKKERSRTKKEKKGQTT